MLFASLYEPFPLPDIVQSLRIKIGKLAAQILQILFVKVLRIFKVGVAFEKMLIPLNGFITDLLVEYHFILSDLFVLLLVVFFCFIRKVYPHTL
jgi:hypothetical protein